MIDLREQLEHHAGEVARLEREIRAAPCREVGHRMKHIGGMNAGCSEWCACSVPVHSCEVCGDSDYGDNDDAVQARADCAAKR